MGFEDLEEDQNYDSARSPTDRLGNQFPRQSMSNGQLIKPGRPELAEVPEPADGDYLPIGRRIVDLAGGSGMPRAVTDAMSPNLLLNGAQQDTSGGSLSRVIPQGPVLSPSPLALASSQKSAAPVQSNEAGTNGAPTIGNRILDMTAQKMAPSRIPKQAPATPQVPPNVKLDREQLRETLSGLTGRVRGPWATPLGASPSGGLMLDMTAQVKAPSRIPRQYDSGQYFSNVNTGLIVTNEGGSLRKGYVPNNKSGVTIAGGFDLGQHSLADLRNLGLPQTLVDQMSPYIGLTGQAARDALKKKPLNVNRDQAAQIDKSALNSYLNATGRAFNGASSSMEFSNLPWQAQTTIADLWYNMGDLRDSAPTLWRQATSGDWEGAYRNLMHFTEKDKTLAERARRNARLLRDAMDVGALPGHRTKAN